MKNCCSVEMEGEIQMVELIKFEPVTQSVWAAFQRGALERGTVCFIWNYFSPRHDDCNIVGCLNLSSWITSVFTYFSLSQWLCAGAWERENIYGFIW